MKWIWFWASENATQLPDGSQRSFFTCQMSLCVIVSHSPVLTPKQIEVIYSTFVHWFTFYVTAYSWRTSDCSRSVNDCSLGLTIFNVDSERHKVTRKDRWFSKYLRFMVETKKINDQHVIKGRLRETRY